jgi:ABC-type transport system involved in multi-copper enzyme maturation permease subunit
MNILFTCLALLTLGILVSMYIKSEKEAKAVIKAFEVGKVNIFQENE